MYSRWQIHHNIKLHCITETSLDRKLNTDRLTSSVSSTALPPGLSSRLRRSASLPAGYLDNTNPMLYTLYDMFFASMVYCCHRSRRASTPARTFLIPVVKVLFKNDARIMIWLSTSTTALNLIINTRRKQSRGRNGRSMALRSNNTAGHHHRLQTCARRPGP